MKRKLWTVLAVFAMVAALLPLSAIAAVAAPGTSVFINEIHYDNTGSDSGEAVEVAGPAGTDLTGWSIVLYNGNGGASYNTTALSGTLADDSNGYGFVVLDYPSNGIQNGAPDGLALVDASNNVVQFLSYEGTFAAVGGAADGMTSTDIGVSEGGSDPAGESLQLTGTGSAYEDFTWAGSATSTFGAVNTGQTLVTATSSPFINEIHYDNTSTDTGEAIEVAGPAGTDLTGWSILLYNGNGGAVYDTIALSGTIPDQDSGYGTLSFPRAGIQNGSPDGLALVDASNGVVQFLSYEGSFIAVGGAADGMTSTDIGVEEASSSAVGDSLQLTGSGTAYEDFTWAASQPNTFGAVNTGQSFGIVLNAPVVVDCGDTLFSTEGFEATRTIEASDADGTVVDIAITSSPVAGITLGDLVPASGVGETASAVVTVDATTAPGSYGVELTATNDDAEPQTATCTLDVTVDPILSIGTVQGSVSDTDNGATFDSTYVGDYVTIQAVVTQQVLSRTSSGDNSYGYFLQNTAATADGDPNSSDGIFLYTGSFDDIYVGPGYYTPQVGDELIIRAKVSEYFHLTELSSASLVSIVRTGVDVDAETPAFVTNPPADLDDANRYWERHEGMRAEIPSGSFALGGRDVFASTADGEVWVATPDSPIASFSGYARRAFRDERNLASGVAPGNGYRIVMGSLGIKATAGDNTALIAPVRTYDTLTAPAVGGVYFSFAKYQIQVGSQLELDAGLNPANDYPPRTPNVEGQYSLTTFNMENLYDYRNDPFDGCDFTTDTGCPGVTPPFDYVPASDAAYQTRLGEIASQVINSLHAPDVVYAQELEDQDICSVDVSWTLVCGATNNADGKPDTLQELTTKIYAQSGIMYDTAYDRDGADDRGIVNGYMFRTDRVELLPADASDPVLGSDPQVVYRSDGLGFNTDVQNPKSLNADLPGDVDTSTGTDGDLVFTRAPLVGHFRIWQEAVGLGAYTDAYLIDNH
ncbi:MAG: hypothetical protein WBV06_05515, partial [Acidimicrobiia bacterium]